MKTINYTPEGEAISDFNVNQWLDDFLLNAFVDKANISSHIVIDEIRARIKEGSIIHGEIEIYIEGELFPVDENGRSDIWYPSQDVQQRILMRLL